MEDFAVTASTPSKRLYNIRNSPPYFYTGRLPEGMQTLINVQLPDLFMVIFDAEGNYLRTSTKVILQERHLAGASVAEAPPESAYDEFTPCAHEWQRELGVTPGTISVKQFYLPERYVGITDLPEHYQEVLDHPEYFDADRLQELQGDIEGWLGSGEFVLDLDIDYYMSEEGDVNST